MVILLSIFGGISIEFFMVAAPIYFSTNSVEGSLFSTPSLPFVISCLLMIAILTEEPSLVAQMVKNLHAMQETWD